MSQGYGTFRSNFFRVNDANAFDEWCEKWGFQHLEVVPGEYEYPREMGGVRVHGFTAGPGHYKGFPCGYQVAPDDTDNPLADGQGFVDADPLSEIAKHLWTGDVAVVIGCSFVGSYANGWATAVNSQGQARDIYLSDIFEQAKDMGNLLTGIR